MQWLRADLQAHADAQCTLAYWHHARWSSGPHGNDVTVAPFVAALHEFGADVILVGHDHLYERFAPQLPDGTADADGGIRQFVVGTGGRSLYSFGTPQPNSEVRYNATYGVIKLVLGVGGRFVSGGSELIVPIGVSLGRRVNPQGSTISIVPYVQPTLFIVAGNGSDVAFALGLGADFRFTPRFDGRLSAGLGDLEGVSLGFVWVH